MLLLQALEDVRVCMTATSEQQWEGVPNQHLTAAQLPAVVLGPVTTAYAANTVSRAFMDTQNADSKLHAGISSRVFAARNEGNKICAGPLRPGDQCVCEYTICLAPGPFTLALLKQLTVIFCIYRDIHAYLQCPKPCG